jgi:hypothetical protein
VTRFLALTLGLAAAATALYLLASDSGRAPVASGPPLDEIDAESRAQLERVLRDSDAEFRPGADRQGGD